jgi:hypothetical protein
MIEKRYKIRRKLDGLFKNPHTNYPNWDERGYLYTSISSAKSAITYLTKWREESELSKYEIVEFAVTEIETGDVYVLSRE